MTESWFRDIRVSVSTERFFTARQARKRRKPAA